MKKICKLCEKEFKGRDKSKYCSRQCRDDARRKSRAIVCEFCGKTKELGYSHNRIKYCSYECYHSSRRPKITICEVCKNEFKPAHNNGQKYCSRECYFSGSGSRKETKIEKELYEFLNDRKIEYVKQKFLEFTVPDAYIPELNLCIYADGIYWHSYKKNKGKDYRQNKKLLRLGYNFIRLKEQKKDFSLDLEPLKQLLQSNSI